MTIHLADAPAKAIASARGEVKAASLFVAQDPSVDLREYFLKAGTLSPSTKRQVVPKSPNQRHYLDADREPRHRLRHRPGRHRQDLPRRGDGRLRSSSPRRSRGSCWRGRRSRPARSSDSCRATCRTRSIPTCGRSTTRSTTCSSPSTSTRLLERGSSRSRRIAFMRGRTLNDAFVILDEAQNTTVGADEDVPDAPRARLEGGHHRRRHADGPAHRAGARDSSRRSAWCANRGHLDRFALTVTDVVRHKLVQQIVKAYAEYTSPTSPAPAPTQPGEAPGANG